jgi:DNA-binding transcriptional LysR family regulator
MSSIRTLKTFLAVVRHGTFAAAGAKIGLTPAAVGLQVRLLERELNCELFIRTGRSITLGPQGRPLVPKIEAIVEAYNAMIHVDEGDELSGPVAVGALVSALMGAFSDALRTIKQRHPKLHVTLYAGLSSDFAYKVQYGELDAAVVTQSPHPLNAELVWTPLYTEPMVAIAPRNGDATAAEMPTVHDVLNTLPFLRFDKRTWTGRLVQEALQYLGVRPDEEMELNSIETIIELVRQGFGGSIVPRLANVDWENDQRLRVIELPGAPVARHVGLLERRSHLRRNFTQEIKAYFSAAMPASH